MAIRNLTFATAVWGALASGFTPVLAHADEAVAAAPTATASAPARRPDGPLLRTPAEKRSDGTAPDLRPEQAVVPQISIPLGRNPQPTQPPLPARPNPASTAPASAATAEAGTGGIGGISDGVARCEAQLSAMERAACRASLARQSPPPR